MSDFTLEHIEVMKKYAVELYDNLYNLRSASKSPWREITQKDWRDIDKLFSKIMDEVP